MYINCAPYRLKKGCGYHLDLLVLAVIIIISSIFGLPWFVANTIPSINHMQSLAKVYYRSSLSLFPAINVCNLVPIMVYYFNQLY